MYFIHEEYSERYNLSTVDHIPIIFGLELVVFYAHCEGNS